MNRKTLLSVAAGIAVGSLALTACGSPPAKDKGSSATKAAAAKSADDLGGMSALVKAAKKEGALNVIALPPDWANYGNIIKAFSDKYGIKVNSALPDGASQDEINAATQQKGKSTAPDVFDLGQSVALRTPRCSRRTRSRRSTTSPARSRTPTARGSTTTAATWPSATTPRRS